MYGPLPAPAEAVELSHFSALSALAALAAAVPPCSRTSFELTMPVDGFARIDRQLRWRVSSSASRPCTSPAAETVTPASRKAGFPFRLMSRFSEKTTSAEVSGVPSAKWTFRLSWNANVFASVARPPRRDEQRDRRGEVAALVGEERVVDRAVDDRRGRIEGALRVRRLDRERVVDHECRSRSRCA